MVKEESPHNSCLFLTVYCLFFGCFSPIKRPASLRAAASSGRVCWIQSCVDAKVQNAWRTGFPTCWIAQFQAPGVGGVRIVRWWGNRPCPLASGPWQAEGSRQAEKRDPTGKGSRPKGRARRGVGFALADGAEAGSPASAPAATRNIAARRQSSHCQARGQRSWGSRGEWMKANTSAPATGPTG